MPDIVMACIVMALCSYGMHDEHTILNGARTDLGLPKYRASGAAGAAGL